MCKNDEHRFAKLPQNNRQWYSSAPKFLLHFHRAKRELVRLAATPWSFNGIHIAMEKTFIRQSSSTRTWHVRWLPGREFFKSTNYFAHVIRTYTRVAPTRLKFKRHRVEIQFKSEIFVVAFYHLYPIPKFDVYLQCPSSKTNTRNFTRSYANTRPFEKTNTLHYRWVMNENVGPTYLFLKNRSAAGVCETVRFKQLANDLKGGKISKDFSFFLSSPRLSQSEYANEAAGLVYVGNVALFVDLCGMEFNARLPQSNLFIELVYHGFAIDTIKLDKPKNTTCRRNQEAKTFLLARIFF